MLAGIDVALVLDLAAIEVVLQDQIQDAARERPAAGETATGALALLAADASPVEFLLEERDGAELGIAPEDHAHRLGLGLVDDQLAVPDVVAERDVAAHPHALGLRRRDLVADALAGDLALELGEREQHVERQPAHRRRRVELLRHRDERGAVRVEHVDDLGEVGQRARQPVDLVDDDDLHLAGLDVGEQPLERRPLHGAAGEAAVVIEVAHGDPAGVLLARDVGLARLALRIERVELLLEPLLGGLAGVDGAGDAGHPSRLRNRCSRRGKLPARDQAIARLAGRREVGAPAPRPR